MMLDVRARLIVIVGGGGVASRKAAGLLDAGATRVRAVSLDFQPTFPVGIDRLHKPYDRSDLDGAALVFAATSSPSVNQAVVADAHKIGALVCRADADAESPGDFATPAAFRRGEVVVSTSAGSAALAVTIRNGLAERFDPRWEAMATALQSLRPRIQQRLAVNDSRRAALLRDLAGEAALAVLASGGEAALWAWLNQRLEADRT
jgi:precorrin-2 dehydrogenase/sirohydrochlorin ferrochelatase